MAPAYPLVHPSLPGIEKGGCEFLFAVHEGKETDLEKGLQVSDYSEDYHRDKDSGRSRGGRVPRDILRPFGAWFQSRKAHNALYFSFPCSRYSPASRTNNAASAKCIWTLQGWEGECNSGRERRIPRNSGILMGEKKSFMGKGFSPELFTYLAPFSQATAHRSPPHWGPLYSLMRPPPPIPPESWLLPSLGSDPKLSCIFISFTYLLSLSLRWYICSMRTGTLSAFFPAVLAWFTPKQM